MNLQELIARRDGYKEQATTAFLAGKNEDGNRLLGLAEKATESIEGATKAANLKPLRAPGQAAADGGSFMPIGGQPQAGNDGATKAAQMQQSAYVARFGDMDDAVKSILTDLHGGDYAGKFYAQKAAFNKFLRKGEFALERPEFDLLKQIILTPGVVKSALINGFDSVESTKATMGESIDSLGGFAAPVDFQTRVIERIQGLAVVRSRAAVDTTSRDRVEYPVIKGGDSRYTSAVRTSWTSEVNLADITTNLTLGSEVIPVHTMMAEAWLSRNSVEDAAFNIEEHLTRRIGESAALEENEKFLIGTGAGAPQGILPGGSNGLSLSRVFSGSTTGVTWDQILALYYGVASQYRANAVWLMEGATALAISQLKDSNFGYLWQPFQYQGGAMGPEPMLRGKAVLEDEAMPSIANGAYPIVFGDMSGYQIIDRVGMTIERYLDSAPARKNAIVYVMRRRVGGQVIEPWRFSVMQCATS